MPTRKVSADLSREAFGLIGLTTRKAVLEQLELELAVAAAVKGLADQRALGTQVAQRELDRQFHQVPDRAASDAGMPERFWAMSETTTSTGRPASDALEFVRRTAASRKSPWMNCTPSIGSKSSTSSATMRAVQRPGRRATNPCLRGRETAPEVLTPRAGHRTEVDDQLPGRSRRSASSISA